MKKKIILRVLILLLILILGYESYSYVKDLSISNKPLDVNTKEIIKGNDKSIAIWVQDSEDDEWHEATNRDSWPSPTTHGYVGAECTDSEGSKVDSLSIISFDLNTYTATIKTKQTIYCTLYFAKGEPALDHLKAKGGSTFAGGGEHTTIVDGMYRFRGDSTLVTSNYICFGTTVEDVCTTNASGNYMYRIIGITSEDDSKINLYKNQLKIIRAVPYNTKQQWGKNGLDNSNWGSSQVKNYLNSTFLSSISTYWNSMISQHGWYIKDQTSSSGYAEPKDGQIISGDANNRIGLMYLTDYNIAGNWILIKNSWNSNTAIEEWTMTRYGYDDEMAWWYAWAVNSYGTLQYRYVGTEDAVRPVFYLQSNVNLTGEGTKDHPYIITTMNNA